MLEVGQEQPLRLLPVELHPPPKLDILTLSLFVYVKKLCLNKPKTQDEDAQKRRFDKCLI